jgi:hypothetical protein
MENQTHAETALPDTTCYPLEYQPECWTMKKDTIYAARTALEAGLENTQELLADHDVKLGRTTRSNRYTAERLEGEIRDMKAAIEKLNPTHTAPPAVSTDLFAVDNGGGGYLIQDANGKTVGSLTRSQSMPCIWHLRDENSHLVDYDRHQNDIRERRGILSANAEVRHGAKDADLD